MVKRRMIIYRRGLYRVLVVQQSSSVEMLQTWLVGVREVKVHVRVALRRHD